MNPTGCKRLLPTRPEWFLQRVREMSLEGHSVREIAEELQVTQNCISGYRWRLRLCDPAKNPCKLPPFSQLEKDEIFRLRVLGRTILQISEITRRSKLRIARVLEERDMNDRHWNLSARPPRIRTLGPPSRNSKGSYGRQELPKPSKPEPEPRVRADIEAKFTGGRCEIMGPDGEDCGKPAVFNPFGRRTPYCLEHYRATHVTRLRAEPVLGAT